jgi:hypothetical protein
MTLGAWIAAVMKVEIKTGTAIRHMGTVGSNPLAPTITTPSLELSVPSRIDGCAGGQSG